MNSAGSSIPIDLEAGLCTRPEDVTALRQARRGAAMSLEEYLDFLTGLESAAIATMRAPRGLRGDTPFEL
jgi:hypothetical protein